MSQGLLTLMIKTLILWMEHCGTLLDVVSEDRYVVVSVRACVFMPEANNMAQLVHHNTEFVTVLSNGNGLRASTPLPHVGTAPGRKHTNMHLISMQHLRLAKGLIT